MNEPLDPRVLYVEVLFGDNDFGAHFESALKQIWKWIYCSNRHLLHDRWPREENERSMSDLFRKLHNVSKLKEMILYLFTTHYLGGHVEFATRGLHRKGQLGLDQEFKFPVIDTISSYFSNIEIVLHDDGAFMKKDQNGEHAWLNCETGMAGTI